MERPKIDLLKQKSYIRVRRNNPMRFFGRGLALSLVVLATCATIFSYQVTITANSDETLPNISFLSTIKQLVTNGTRNLKGENEDRVNLLLLGIGGEGHDGPQLTDTIIFASYRPSDEKIGMMSLPRDMSVPIPNYGYRKVNHANAYGELDGTGRGPVLASEVVGNVLDQEIQYYFRVDFNGFAEFIDAIGGVDIYVEQTFTDSNYPIDGKEYDSCGYETPNSGTALALEDTKPNDTQTQDADNNNEITTDDSIVEPSEETNPNKQTQAAQVVFTPDYSCRFQSITFNEGWTHMDGKTALKFVRSRHGNNGEGSDFARSKRQQKVILAVKDKTLSASTFLNPSRISKMLDSLQDNIATNMNVWEIARFARVFKNLKNENITNHVIDASDDSPLYATVLNGAYVLLPKNDDWSNLQYTTQNIFTPDEKLTEIFLADEEKPKFVRVEIQNGTEVSGLAFRASQLLNSQGFDIVKIGNAASRDYEHTVIYDLTDGKRAEELKALKTFLQADVTLSATGWMMSGNIVPKEIKFSIDDYENLATEEGIDFLVVLGESASSLAKF